MTHDHPTRPELAACASVARQLKLPRSRGDGALLRGATRLRDRVATRSGESLSHERGRQPRAPRRPWRHRTRPRLDHVGVLLDTPEDVDAWAAYLTAGGATLAAAPKTHRDGCRSCYAADPEGTKIQFLFHPALSCRKKPR